MSLNLCEIQNITSLDSYNYVAILGFSSFGLKDSLSRIRVFHERFLTGAEWVNSFKVVGEYLGCLGKLG